MEYGRTREGERRMKRYNGIVLLERAGYPDCPKWNR